MREIYGEREAHPMTTVFQKKSSDTPVDKERVRTLQKKLREHTLGVCERDRVQKEHSLLRLAHKIVCFERMLFQKPSEPKA